MKKLVLVVMVLFLAGCTVTKGDLSFSLMQMQTAKYAASAMSTTGVGMEIEMTGQANPFPKIRLGYFRHGTVLVPSIKDGYYMPFVIIDTGVNPFNKDGVTDSICVGEKCLIGEEPE